MHFIPKQLKHQEEKLRYVFFALEDRYKHDSEICFQKFIQQFESSSLEHFYRVQSNKLVRNKEENLRMFALQGKQTVDRRWPYASKDQKNNFYTGYFTKVIQAHKKLLRYSLQLTVEYISTNEYQSLDFDTLVEKCELRDISMELQDNNDDDDINYVQRLNTSNTNPNNKSNPAFKMFCTYFQNPGHSISMCWKKRILFHHQQ